jgi:hypothetical protein
MRYQVVIQQNVPVTASRAYAARPIRGYYVHHTGGRNLYTPGPDNNWGSAHVVILPDGTRYIQVADNRAAFAVL